LTFSILFPKWKHFANTDIITTTTIRKAGMKSFKGPLAIFKGMLFSFAQVRGILATNKQQNAPG
jgi:hypothetical protein